MSSLSSGLGRRPRVFTWHVHGSYLYYLSQANCDFYIPVGRSDSHGYDGKGDGSAFTLGDNVHEVPVGEIPNTDFDVILFQHRPHYETDQYQIFSEAQRRLPKVYIEHDPPWGDATETEHVVHDPSVLVVHCTDFNRLMWNTNGVPTTVIDHGVTDPQVPYDGRLEKGIVVINNLGSRGRRLGRDLFEYARTQVPLDLVGINATDIRGLGEVPLRQLPAFVAQYRFFFTPIRYTSLGLSILESMMVGVPVVGLATTELVSVIENGVNGYASLDPERLIADMKRLLASHELARSLGAKGQATARERFNIGRFARDWEHIFRQMASGADPAQAFPNPVENAEERP